MAASLSCGEESPTDLLGPTTGSIQVVTTTSGTGLDSDGYQLTVDGGILRQIGVNDTLVLSEVAEGPHTVELLGVAHTCTPLGGSEVSITVISGESKETRFTVECTNPLLGQWDWVSVVIDDWEPIVIDRAVFTVFAESQVEFFAEDWTENRGLPNDRATGLYSTSPDLITITWNGIGDWDAANDWFGHHGAVASNQSQSGYSFDAGNLILEVTVNGHYRKYTCVRR